MHKNGTEHAHHVAVDQDLRPLGRRRVCTDHWREHVLRDENVYFSMDLACCFLGCTISLVHVTSQIKWIFGTVTLDMVTWGTVHLPGDGRSGKADVNFLFIKQLPISDYQHLNVWISFSTGECSKLDLTLCINHYLSISEGRYIPPRNNLFFMHGIALSFLLSRIVTGFFWSEIDW